MLQSKKRLRAARRTEWPATDLAYLAALVDGEGCLSPAQGGARIRIGMTDSAAVAWCHATFGGVVAVQPPTETRKQQYLWALSAQPDVAVVLEAMLPHTRVKRGQVLASLDLARHNKDGAPCSHRNKDPEKQAERAAWVSERVVLNDRAVLARGAVEVLALDPGERVGWARAVVLPDGTWLDFNHGITPLWDMATALSRAQYKYEYVVVEEWRLYPHMANQFVGSSFPSVQFIGAVRLLAHLNPTQKLVMQGASVKKTADKTMAKLRPDLHELVTRPIKHDDGHDLDAIRHLWVYTYRNTSPATLLRGVQ